MPKITNGTFGTGPNKGNQWQTYADPSQPTGWTRKSWNPYDTSNNGGPTEYFEPYNAAAADYDEQAAQDAQAQAAAQQAEAGSKEAALRDAALTASGRAWNEGVRQFNVGQDYKDRSLSASTAQNAAQTKIQSLDARTRMKLGLRQIELQEQQNASADQRGRESNVLSYLQTISKLRLPYDQLQLLSQRAVAGIIPGGGGSAAGAGGAPGSGSLTADQWQAAAQGLNNEWQANQVGQGSPLRG